MQTLVYVYSGSFDPLHAGHLNIINYTEDTFNVEVLPEICRCPFDKVCLSDSEVDRRVSQFSILGRSVWVSDSPSIVGKSIEFFSGKSLTEKRKTRLTFCVGHDTIVRVGDPKYYFGSEVEMRKCLARLKKMNVGFLVFPRHGKLKDGLSEQLLDLCEFAGPDFIESPLSSTEIRTSRDRAPTELERYARRKDFS